MDASRRLSWRDGIATLITAFVVLLTAAVTNEWGWPVVGSSYRVGGLILFAAGLATCIVAGESMAGKRSDPFLTAAKWLSVLAPALLLATLIFATAPFLVGLAAVIVALWLLATLHHFATGIRGMGARTTTT